MSFRPLGSKVLIKRGAGEKVRPSGLLIPDAYVEKSSRCDVVAVGPGKWSKAVPEVRIAPPVSPGDKVLIGGWEGAAIELDGEAHLVIESDAILAVEGP